MEPPAALWRGAASRTVEAGIARPAPIRRCPNPSARATNADQIRSAAFALRTNTITGSTCVTAQARHRARLGRTNRASPAIRRTRAYPSRPARPSYKPDARSGPPPTGTRRGQGQPLPSPSVPPALQRALRPVPAKTRRVPRAHQFLVTLTVHTNPINPATTPTTTSATSVKNGRAAVVIQRDGQHHFVIAANSPCRRSRRWRCPCALHACDSDKARLPQPRRRNYAPDGRHSSTCTSNDQRER